MSRSYNIKELEGLVEKYVDSFCNQILGEKRIMDFRTIGISTDVAEHLDSWVDQGILTFTVTEEDRAASIEAITEAATAYMDENYVDGGSRDLTDQFIGVLENGNNTLGEEDIVIMCVVDGKIHSLEDVVSMAMQETGHLSPDPHNPGTWRS